MYVYSINYEYLVEKFSAMYDDKEIVSNGNAPKLIANFYPEKAKDAGKYLLESTDSELSQDATTTLALYDYSSNPTKKDGEYIYGKTDLFALLIIIKQMISKDEFKLLIKAPHSKALI